MVLIRKKIFIIIKNKFPIICFSQIFYVSLQKIKSDMSNEGCIDVKVIDILNKKYIESCKRDAFISKVIEDKKKKEDIYKQITKDVKFVSKFVKKCQSRQNGEKTVFYDIDIEKLPIIKPYGEFIGLSNKYYKLRGRSLNLSMYASIKESIFLDDSAICYIIPALKYAYEDYVKDNFYGKEIEFEGEICKAFQIDWFDEVYIADKKIETVFQKKIKELEEHYQSKINKFEYPKEYEPESWERAWIDYVERYDTHDYLFNCQEMINHPENYGIDVDEYIKEAEKITHRKFHRKNFDSGESNMCKFNFCQYYDFENDKCSRNTCIKLNEL